ncbi:MAG: hypothetical protein IJ132_05440, partial [Firmicutes bacterium]|nr:hypothetical protein [Bacillota bacterium]
LIVVNAKRNGIDTDDTNKNDIKISSSNVVIGVDDRDGNCINSGWKKGGISITDSIVEMSNSYNSEPTSTSKGGYNALSASGTVNIKDSYVTAENRQKDRPAMLVYEDTGKLIISGESMLGCQNVEGGSASALMANAIELKDGNRLFMPKDGYIGKTKYNGGSGEKEMYTVFDKDGNTTEKIGFGSGKELIHTVSAPSKVFPGTPIHMSGVLKDENGNPVPNALLYIEYEETFSREVTTNDKGIWEYKEDAFTPSDPGEVSFRIHYFGVYVDGESPVKGYVRYLPPSESPGVNVQVINEGFVETLIELKQTNPPEGESRKTEYKCGEEFDLDASYVQAIIKREEATGETTSEARPLDPRATTITPSVLKYGTDEVNIRYMFEGATASIDYDVTVAHDWKEATCTESKTCKSCGTTEGEALGHKYGDWTKLDANQHQRVCEHDANHIEKGNHKWDAGKVTTPATTTEKGVKTYTCTVCNATRTETIDKLAKKANPLKIKAKTATVKYKKLKKKSQTISRAKAITVSGAQGKLAYKKVSVTYTKAKSVKMSKKALKKYKKKAA